METKKSNTSLTVTIVVLVMTLLFGGTLLVLYGMGYLNFKTDSIKEPVNNNVNEEENKTSNIAGMYNVTLNNLKNIEDKNNISTASITLNLYENGIFTYELRQNVPSGVLGNYTIKDNKITLIYWFNTDSGTTLRITKGTKILTIDSDGSIIDNNIKIENLINNNINTIKLTKSDNKPQFDLSNRLSAAFFNESYHTIEEPNI